MTNITMVQALNLALRQEMEKDDGIILLGEDVGVDGGVFRVTEGLIEKFGEQRVLDTLLQNPVLLACRSEWRPTDCGRYAKSSSRDSAT